MEYYELKEELKNIFAAEAEMLNNFASEEQILMKDLQQKDWTNLNAHIKNLNEIGTHIENLETRRNELWQNLMMRVNSVSTPPGFYRFVSELTGTEREDWITRYRKLCVAVVRVQAITSRMDNYVSTNLGSLRGILEEIFPHQKGKIYSKKGYSQNSEQKSLLVNKER